MYRAVSLPMGLCGGVGSAVMGGMVQIISMCMYMCMWLRVCVRGDSATIPIAFKRRYLCLDLLC